MMPGRHIGAFIAVLAIACSGREPLTLEQRRVLLDAGPAPSCGPVGAAPIGAPCECASDCAAGICLDEAASGIPGGLCWRYCTPGDDSCGPSAICGLPPDSGGTRGCVPRCAASADCPRGWHCSDEACRPRCVEDGDCQGGRVCDRSTGRCVEVRRAGRGTFERCVDFAECRSGMCSDEGRCASLCVLGLDSCPPTETCVWAMPGDEGPFGTCAPRCLRDDDCGEGLACVLRGRPGVTERVCYPSPRGVER